MGNYVISKRDAEQRDKVISVFYPGNVEKDAGFQQLLDAYTYAEILKQNGHKIDDAVVQNELERIDRETKAPEMLANIKSIFGSDVDAYKRVFVLPTYAERVIYYGFFLNNPVAQAKPIAMVNKVLVLGGKAGAAQAHAKAHGLKTINLIYSDRIGLDNEDKPRRAHNPSSTPLPPKVQQAMDEQKKAQKSSIQAFLEKHAAFSKKAGDILPEPLDMEAAWVVLQIKNVDIKKRTIRFLGISVPRADYQVWLNNERARVKIEKISP